jgi:hypothetical protein
MRPIRTAIPMDSMVLMMVTAPMDPMALMTGVDPMDPMMGTALMNPTAPIRYKESESMTRIAPLVIDSDSYAFGAMLLWIMWSSKFTGSALMLVLCHRSGREASSLLFSWHILYPSISDFVSSIASK